MCTYFGRQISGDKFLQRISSYKSVHAPVAEICCPTSVAQYHMFFYKENSGILHATNEPRREHERATNIGRHDHEHVHLTQKFLYKTHQKLL